MVSFIIDSEVLEVVLEPLRNCGTTGTAKALIGNNNNKRKDSLVNSNRNFSRPYTASS